MRARAAVVALALVASGIVSVGCGGGSGDDARVVLRVADVQRTVDDFAAFVSDYTDEGEAVDALAPEVRSRLFDLWVDEQLLLEEARRRGITLDDAAVDAWLADVLPEDEPADDADRQRAYVRLAQLRLQEEWAAEIPPVTEAEVDARLAETGLVEARRVELRSLLLPDANEAGRLHREIRRGRLTFDEAIALHQDPSMPNAPFRVTWETVDPSLREALEGLRPGRVTEPQELHGNHYLFQFIGTVEEPTEEGVRRRDRVRRELATDRAREFRERRLRELRDEIDWKSWPSRLPFRYVAAEDGPAAGG